MSAQVEALRAELGEIERVQRTGRDHTGYRLTEADYEALIDIEDRLLERLDELEGVAS